MASTEGSLRGAAKGLLMQSRDHQILWSWFHEGGKALRCSESTDLGRSAGPRDGKGTPIHLKHDPNRFNRYPQTEKKRKHMNHLCTLEKPRNPWSSWARDPPQVFATCYAQSFSCPISHVPLHPGLWWGERRPPHFPFVFLLFHSWSLKTQEKTLPSTSLPLPSLSPSSFSCYYAIFQLPCSFLFRCFPFFSSGWENVILEKTSQMECKSSGTGNLNNVSGTAQRHSHAY